MNLILRLRRLYAPKPEPLQTLPELIERAKRARAQVYEMTVAADRIRGGA